MHMCVPLSLYLILVLFGVLMVPQTRSTASLITHGAVLAILYVLCKNGYNKLAWFVLLWPFIQSALLGSR